jgi:hypothetical protein
MWRTIFFYWECAKAAAHGTIERANAWFWLIGLPIVAFAGWYWEVGELIIPDNPRGFVTFMIVMIAVTWVVFFVFRFLGAPARLHARREDEKHVLEERISVLELQRATLALSGPHLHNDARHVNRKLWRMKVHNSGPATARDVKIRLQNAAPGPQDENWAGDYPYAVYPDGTITNDPGHIAVTGRHIHKDSDEMYNITCGWKGVNGQFYTDINTKGGGHNNIQITQSERWKFYYEVTAENACPVQFVLELFH